MLRVLCRNLPRIARAGALSSAMLSSVAFTEPSIYNRDWLTSNYHPQGIDNSERRILEAREAGRQGLREAITPHRTGFITARTAQGTEHKVYYEVSGNPEGQPVTPPSKRHRFRI